MDPIRILCFVAVFFLGVKIGKQIQTQKIIDVAELIEYNENVIRNNEEFIKTIKQTNNQMLNNCAELYREVYGQEGEFTDIDAKLMEMWMD